MKKFLPLLCLTILIATSASAAKFPQKKQRIFLEASQVVTRVLICGAEVANVEPGTPEREEFTQCLRDGLADDVVIVTSGGTLNGIDEVVGFFAGVAADQRTNVTPVLSNFLVTHIKPGPKPGTGSVEFLIEASAYQDIVSPIGPFGDVLGPQFLVNRNLIRLEAEEPGEWKFVEAQIIPSVRPQPRPQYEGPNAFP